MIDNCPKKHATKEHIRNLFRQMYDYAYSHDLCEKNYAGHVRINTPDDDEKGEPFTEEDLRISAYRKLESIGIRRHTPHDCRHTFSWLCDKYKVDTLSKKMLLGHSLGTDVTDLTYGHRTVEELRAEKKFNLQLNLPLPRLKTTQLYHSRQAVIINTNEKEDHTHANEHYHTGKTKRARTYAGADCRISGNLDSCSE